MLLLRGCLPCFIYVEIEQGHSLLYAWHKTLAQLQRYYTDSNVMLLFFEIDVVESLQSVLLGCEEPTRTPVCCCCSS